MIHFVRLLAAGGFGELWEGRFAANGQRVVVKFLKHDADRIARRGFARELRILQRQFQGMVPCLFGDLNAPRPYYVMPFMQNGALGRWAGHLNRGQLFTIASDVALILARLHRHGIAHGDVKPDNLLLGDDGHVRVADPIGCGWGCTVLFAQNCGGTPGYWAPEIKRGGAISTEADVYSFGATVHHLASGLQPVDGRALDLRCARLIESPELREVVVSCCQSDPQLRPQMGDIRRLLMGESWQRIRETRQRWALAGGTAALLFLLGSSTKASH